MTRKGLWRPRWKARGRLYIRCNWTFFAISYRWDVISGNRSKSAFFEGGGGAFRGKGTPPTNQCWYQKTRDCRFVWYQNICSPSFSFVTIHASDGRTDRWTDRQTDRQNCDSNTVRCITCSRTVKMLHSTHGESVTVCYLSVDVSIARRTNLSQQVRFGRKVG